MMDFDDSLLEIFQVDKEGNTSFEDKFISDIDKMPVVYLLSNKLEMYVGETVDIKKRFASHNKNNEKGCLDNRYAIYAPYFNKSVTLHLETFLINHFSGDEIRLLNANIVTTNHHFYQKKSYQELFPLIWEKLLQKKISKRSYSDIVNSNIFKYSPYKALTTDQEECILFILQSLLENRPGVVVNGAAGTGKTIVLIYLIKLLTTPLEIINTYDLESEFALNVYNLLESIYEKEKSSNASFKSFSDNIALVVSMTSLRETLKNVFKKINGLNSSMVIAPHELRKKRHKILLVDESHRLRRRSVIQGYKLHDETNKELGLSKDGTELDWILKQSTFQIFVYDSKQSIRPSDIVDFQEKLLHEDYDLYELKTQVRSKGGVKFIDYVNNLMEGTLKEGADLFESNNFKFLLFDRFKDILSQIKKDDESYGLSRMVAGFSWKWDKSNAHKFDKTINVEGFKLRWNTVVKDWINSKDAINEMGSIHTIYGNDINYVAVIFGREIDFDPINKKIIVDKGKYLDTNGKKTLSDDELLEKVKNIYKHMIFRGVHGVYIYCYNENLKNYFKKHIELNK